MLIVSVQVYFYGAARKILLLIQEHHRSVNNVLSLFLKMKNGYLPNILNFTQQLNSEPSF